MPDLGSGFAHAALTDLLGGAFRAAVYAANLILPNEHLSPDDYIALYQRNMLNASSYFLHMRQLGFAVNLVPSAQTRILTTNQDGLLSVSSAFTDSNMNEIDRYGMMTKNMPTPTEILLLSNRGLITDRAAKQLLFNNFSGEWELAKKWFTLRDQIPGPSDLINFAVRDCFFPDIVAAHQYSRELPVDILPWMKKQGLGGDVGIPLPAGSTTTAGADTRTRAQWFDLYWWSHWQLPSISQGYTMLQRLYPNSSYGPSPTNPPGVSFSTDDLQLLYRADAWSPAWRKRLEAISYQPIGIRYIKLLYASNVIKEDADNHDVYHAYRQLGYSDIDAKRLAALVVKTARKDILDLTIKQIERLYKQGTLGDKEAVDRIKTLDYPERDATYAIENWKLELAADEVDQAIKSVREIYLKADINADQARGYLTTMRLTPSAIDRLFRIWNLQHLAATKHVGASEAVKWFKNSLIPESSLELRLNQLNYNQEETYGIIATAKDEMALRDSKLLDAMQKESVKTIAALTKAREKNAADVAKQQAKDLVAREKSLAKLSEADKKAYTEKNIVAFYKGNFITEDQVKNILEAKGWLPNTISVWMRKWTPPK